MIDIEKTLNILRKFSKSNDKIEQLYRSLYNPEFYKLAYSNIYSKPGNMTKASDNSTIDGMSLDRINKLINSLRDGTYKPTNLRRANISKQNSNKTRLISIPSFDDKLIQEIIRILLNELYESSFSDHSYGFRPNRSCHSCLNEVYLKFKGTVWWIDADIKGCFDNINHEILLNILKEKIRDNKFIHLINLFLKAGYIENHQYHKTYSGTPQGSIISPILCNIYLDKFDKFMEEKIKEYTCGKKRKTNKEYDKANKRVNYLRKVQREEGKYVLFNYQKYIKKYRQERDQLQSNDMYDPEFKRLFYIRYADDFLIGTIGPKQDILEFKKQVNFFLKNNLKLELSEEKTKILHKDDKVRFLGYDINVAQNCSNRRNNGKVNLSVPYDIMINFILDHRTGKWWNNPKSGKDELKAIHRPELINLTVLEIAKQYNFQIKGLYEYYKLANNVYKLSNFNYIHIISYMRTLAAKFKTSRAKLYKNPNYNSIIKVNKNNKLVNKKVVGCKYRLKDGTENFQAIFNGPFEKQNYFKDKDNCKDLINNLCKYSARTSLISRLEANECEYCHDKTGPFEVHHVRHLKNIKSGKANHEKLMISRQRKTLVLCKSCHTKLHSGNL
jgi:group II intron reverse transcriptase/maturase